VDPAGASRLLEQAETSGMRADAESAASASRRFNRWLFTDSHRLLNRIRAPTTNDCGKPG